jgi:hypothetical protein
VVGATKRKVIKREELVEERNKREGERTRATSLHTSQIYGKTQLTPVSLTAKPTIIDLKTGMPLLKELLNTGFCFCFGARIAH